MERDLISEKGGYFNVCRSILTWRFHDDPYTLSLFVSLIGMANYKPAFCNGTIIERGQLLTSLPALSRQTGISIQSLRTSLNKLKRNGEIIEKSTNKFRIITICNYDVYQGCQNTGQQSTNSQLTVKQQSTNSKQERKERKEREEGKAIESTVTDTLPCMPNIDCSVSATAAHACARGGGEKQDSGGEGAVNTKKKRPGRIEQFPLSVIRGVVDFYNNTRKQYGAKIRECRTLTEGPRAKAIRARLAEHGVDLVYEAIVKAAKSDWCNGRTDSNKRGPVDIDWIFTKSYFDRLIDGRYDNRTGQSNDATQGREHQGDGSGWGGKGW